MPVSVFSEHRDGQRAVASSPFAERLGEQYLAVVQLMNERDFARKVRGKYVIGVIKQNGTRLLNEIRSEVEKDPGLLEDDPAAVEMLELCVEVIDYYDELQEPPHAWLSTATRAAYEKLAAGQIGGAHFLSCFRLAVIHLHIDYRRRPLQDHTLDEKFSAIERCINQLYALKKAQAYGAVRRYYDLRAQVVRQTPERYEADRFIDLATTCADMEERFAENVTGKAHSPTMISIGLTRVWTQIAKGNYLHSQELLKPIQLYFERYENDPLTYAKYLVAKNICRRALAGKNPTEVKQVIDDLTKALRIFDELGDRRHLLRCHHERSLCFLLLGDHKQVAIDLEFMERYARVGKQDPSIGWQIQCHIMESRMACQHGKYAEAQKVALDAISLAENARLTLLTIEARNTLAMILFRQGKLAESERHLQEALRLNHDGLRQTDHGDLSQPALSGVSHLYLARVAVLRNDTLAAFTALREWRGLSSKVEHGWVKSLAAEVEEQVLHQCLVEQVLQGEKMDFARQLRMLRKLSIERASRKLGSKKIVDIAKEINVKRQTVHYWIKDLKQQNIPVQL